MRVGLCGNNACALGKLREQKFDFALQVSCEGEIVDENYAASICFTLALPANHSRCLLRDEIVIFIAEEVILNEVVVAPFLAKPAHPPLEFLK